jgi:hypothetical protein
LCASPTTEGVPSSPFGITGQPKFLALEKVLFMSHLRDLRRLVVLAVFTMIAALIVPVATAPPASAQGVTDCTAATISKAECDALVDLYNATGGAATWVSKANWLLAIIHAAGTESPAPMPPAVRSPC